ncbi:MAG: Farnesyl pyrophosphate synthetase [Chaenotheca gracillima]|nr:MAG: Farnesyl pyrophosphate synthetase [Chaenotheca gracillima]
MTLMSAQIQFIDCQLSLIHIPLSIYPLVLQPILRLLLLSDDVSNASTQNGHIPVPWAARHPFLNISVTPVECSIVCLKEYAQKFFEPVVNITNGSKDRISITSEDYTVVQVDGEGLDAGQRVLELTSPLALAGVSIFFITTYFSDYILVPVKSRDQVVSALEDRGFAFERRGDSVFRTAHTYQQNQAHQHRPMSSTSSIEVPPQTPPPSNIAELQHRTFALLQRQNISPHADSTIRLVQCAGRKDDEASSVIRGRRANESHLHLSLIKCLIAQPRLLSLTLTATDSASVLLEERFLPHFSAANSPDGDDALLGSKEDILIPITLDLRGLPLESTGIVCGVAGKLVGGTSGAGAASNGDALPAVEMSYLSTARAGTVMVGEAELGRALEALRGVENGITEE